MGYTYYQTFVLIPTDNPLTFQDVVEKFRHSVHDSLLYPKMEVKSDRIILLRDNWSLRVYWEDSPHVLEESRELAGRNMNKLIDANSIASCNRRITTAGDADPDMKYFNDYVMVLEVLETLSNVYKYDPFEGKFINRYGE